MNAIAFYEGSVSQEHRAFFRFVRRRNLWFNLITEVIRPDEDAVLKTAAGKTVVGSSPTASARRLSVLKVNTCRLFLTVGERFHTGGCNPPAVNCVVVGERCNSLRSHCSFVLRMKLGPNKRKRKIDK